MSDESTAARQYFDIRPDLAAGEPRSTAVEEAIDRFHKDAEVFVGEQYAAMGTTRTLLSMVIEALFDPEHGTDTFGLEAVETALDRLADDGDPPPVSDPGLQRKFDTFDAHPRQVERRILDDALECVTGLREVRQPRQG